MTNSEKKAMAAVGRGIRVGVAIVGCGLLGACAAIENTEREVPKVDLPEGFKNAPAGDEAKAGEDAGKPALLPPASEWWKSFHSAELNGLVGVALANNHDLKVAIARIMQADAQATAAGAAQYPTLDANFKHSTTAPSGGVGTAVDGVYNYSERVPQISLSTAWEVDLWGKNSAAAESALALAQASVHFREGVALSLVADLTKSYVDILAESDHIKVAENNLANARKALQAVTTKMEEGDATIIEVQQQETAVANAEANIPVHRLLRERAFNKLAALMGKTPPELTIAGGSLSDVELPRIAPGIPSQIICRRPDIRRAEANLLSANADIDVARAKMYPTLSFSAEGGKGGYSFTSWLTPESLFYSLIGQLTESIFDAGKNGATLRQTKARSIEMIETYRQTIVEAVHDVEDAMATLRITDEQQLALARAAGHARTAWELSSKSFDRGAVDYTTYLETQRTLFQTEDTETGTRADRLKAAVDLFKALGGGFEEPHC